MGCCIRTFHRKRLNRFWLTELNGTACSPKKWIHRVETRHISLPLHLQKLILKILQALHKTLGPIFHISYTDHWRGIALWVSSSLQCIVGAIHWRFLCWKMCCCVVFLDYSIESSHATKWFAMDEAIHMSSIWSMSLTHTDQPKIWAKGTVDVFNSATLLIFGKCE